MTTFQTAARRGRPSRIGQQYVQLLRARTSLRSAQNIGIRKPAVRTATAKAIDELDSVIALIEGRALVPVRDRLARVDRDMRALASPPVLRSRANEIVVAQISRRHGVDPTRARRSSAKYSASQIDKMGQAGQAWKNPDGSYSHAVADVEDLQAAIAAATGNASLESWLIGRAKKLGAMHLIPKSWKP
jgi:hypothetical protein